MSGSDEQVTVTMPRGQWEALLTVEPYAKETYTEADVEVFNAFRAIRQALDEPPASREGADTNQHWPDVDAHSTGVALLKALRMWQKSGCDCCAPSIWDEAIESLDTDAELWDGFRRFGIELAQTAQNVLDMYADEKIAPIAERAVRLRSAVELAITTLEQLTDPDPQRGLLTNMKQQGEAQGVPLTQTYDAVLDVIAALRQASGEAL